MNLKTHRVKREGTTVKLNPKEFDLLTTTDKPSSPNLNSVYSTPFSTAYAFSVSFFLLTISFSFSGVIRISSVLFEGF